MSDILLGRLILDRLDVFVLVMLDAEGQPGEVCGPFYSREFVETYAAKYELIEGTDYILSRMVRP